MCFEYRVEGITNLCGLNCATFGIAKQTGKSKQIQKNLIKIDTKGIVSEYGLMLPHRSDKSEKFRFCRICERKESGHFRKPRQQCQMSDFVFVLVRFESQ